MILSLLLYELDRTKLVFSGTLYCCYKTQTEASVTLALIICRNYIRVVMRNKM